MNTESNDIENEHIRAVAPDKDARTGDERRARTARILAEVDALLTDEDRAAMHRAMEQMYDEDGY